MVNTEEIKFSYFQLIHKPVEPEHLEVLVILEIVVAN